IDLGSDGVTPNDNKDPDTGANDFQNYPVLSAAYGHTAIGTLNSLPNSTFVIEFFSVAAADSSGHGEGRTYLGSTSVTTDAAGNAAFTAALTTGVAPGQFVSATATGIDSSTSEFSVAFLATAPPPPPGGISGTVHKDLNGNGHTDSG